MNRTIARCAGLALAPCSSTAAPSGAPSGKGAEGRLLMGADVMGAYEDDSSAGGTDYLLVAYGGFWHELRWTPLPWLDLGARVSRRCGLYYLKTSGGVDVSTIVGLEPGLVAGLLFGGFRVQLQASWLIAIGGGPVGGPTVSWSQPTGPSLALSLGLAM